MVNLHYENMPDLNISPDIMVKCAYFHVRPYYEYLKRACEWVMNPELLEYVTWELTKDPLLGKQDRTSGKIGPSNNDNAGPVWVSINEVGTTGELDIIGKFCDADYVIDDPRPKSKWIRIIDADLEQGLLHLERTPQVNERGRFLYLCPNTYCLDQQRKALSHLQKNPHGGHRGLLKLVEYSDRVFWPEVVPKSVEEWEFLTDIDRPGTDEQRKFVKIAMGTPDFAILEGPPGSGKTTAICELILQEIRQDHRVLLCASTHVAVDNVLEVLDRKGVTDTDVVAVRIGDRRRISENVRHFQLEERIMTEQRDLIEKLSSINQRTPSQDYLLEALQSSSESIFSRLILESANLICGTTIGILQHPDIKASRDKPVPKFDLMVLDEASKTLFQEFLVPALFARRWILVGDIKQLSPHVDDINVEGNIRALIPLEDGKVCLDLFECAENIRSPSGITSGIAIVEEDENLRSKYIEQAKMLGLNVLDLESMDAKESPSMEMLGAHVIISKALREDLLRHLPPDMRFHDRRLMNGILTRRHDHWIHAFGRPIHRRRRDDGEDRWEREVSWRLGRTFELRNVPEEATRFHEQLDHLMPLWYPDVRKKDLHGNLNIIKQVSLPSILELVQSGFSAQSHSHGRTTLDNGMRPRDFNKRHVILTHQHRMHPEISRFPREHFYGSDSLKDPHYMASERNWGCSYYPKRAFWMDIRGRVERGQNVNLDEVEFILGDLQRFMAWAKDNPKMNPSRPTERMGPWVIAILPFYKDQEREFRYRLQRYFNTGNKRNFHSPDGSFRIELCNVDLFQGHEADLVYLSFVQTRRTGFMDSPNRLNVALTRAMYQLIMVGDNGFFRENAYSTILRDLADEFSETGISFVRAPRLNLAPRRHRPQFRPQGQGKWNRGNRSSGRKHRRGKH